MVTVLDSAWKTLRLSQSHCAVFLGKNTLPFSSQEKKMGHSKTSRESWKILRGNLKLNCSLRLKRKKRWFQTLQKLFYALEAMWVSFIYRVNKLITPWFNSKIKLPNKRRWNKKRKNSPISKEVFGQSFFSSSTMTLVWIRANFIKVNLKKTAWNKVYVGYLLISIH